MTVVTLLIVLGAIPLAHPLSDDVGENWRSEDIFLPSKTRTASFEEVEVVFGEPEPAEPEVMFMEATAYTWTGNRTATGTWPSRGTVAVDPRIIPLGTKLYIEGYGHAVAEDTGGAIKGNIIDLYMDDRSECLNWGRRQVEVRIVE